MLVEAGEDGDLDGEGEDSSFEVLGPKPGVAAAVGRRVVGVGVVEPLPEVLGEAGAPSKSIVGAALMSPAARAAPPLSWEARVCNLRPHEIAEIVLCMQRFAILYINSASELLLTPYSRIDKIQTDGARLNWYYDKIVTWEWFFGPYYGGRAPRVALEDVSPVLSLHPDWIRRCMRREPVIVRDANGRVLDIPGLSTAARAELYAGGLLLPPRGTVPEEVRRECWFDRGDPELEELRQGCGGQRAWFRGRTGPKPGKRTKLKTPVVVALPEIVLSPVTRQILTRVSAEPQPSPLPPAAVVSALEMFDTLGEAALDLLGNAMATVR